MWDNEDALLNLISSIYPDFDTKYEDWTYLHARGILALINDDVDEINTIMLSMLHGDVKSYMSCHTLSNSNNLVFSVTWNFVNCCIH